MITNRVELTTKKAVMRKKLAIVVETDQSKPISQKEADQSKLVSYTDSNSEEEADLHVDVKFDKPIYLSIN